MPEDRSNHVAGVRTTSRRRKILVVAWLAATALYVVGTATDVADGFLDDVFLPVVFGLLLVLATYGCAGLAVRDRRDRLAWALIAVGIGLWTFGAVCRTVFFDGTDPRTIPAWIDPIFLAFYPAVITALILVIRSRLRRFRDMPLLDTITGLLVMGAIIAAFIYEPVLDSTSGDSLETLTLIAYPAGDVAIIALLAVLLRINGMRRDGPWLWVASGLMLVAIADVLFLLPIIEPGVLSAPLWSLWILGILLIVIGTWHEDRDAREWTPGHAQLLLPLLFSMISIGILAYGQEHDLSTATTWFCLAALVAIALRLFVSARENLKMFEGRDLALVDDLTGAASRRVINERLQKIGRPALPNPRPETVAIIRLKGFKELNAALGYRAADELLSAVATRLNRVVGDIGQLGRLSGSEFSLITHPVANQPSPEALALRIEGSLAYPVTVDGLKVHPDVIIGIAVYPDHGKDGATLLKMADIAVQRAKKKSLSHLVCTGAEDDGSRKRLELVEDLRNGIEHDQLVVVYQPKISLPDRTVAGVEALVRWQRSKDQLLGPGQFLPVAESAGLMHSITSVVLDKALDQVSLWQSHGLTLDVAVNLAMPNLLDAALPADVAVKLADRGIEPERLTVEVTENIIMSDPERVLSTLNQLHDAGVRISLDDFGSGNASLSYLRKLPLDEVKMDRSLITNMSVRPVDSALAEAAIKVTRQLGLTVVAEGVEDLAIVDRLESLDCSEAQGYAFARPMPGSAIEQWLAEYRAAETTRT